FVAHLDHVNAAEAHNDKEPLIDANGKENENLNDFDNFELGLFSEISSDLAFSEKSNLDDNLMRDNHSATEDESSEVSKLIETMLAAWLDDDNEMVDIGGETTETDEELWFNERNAFDNRKDSIGPDGDVTEECSNLGDIE